MRNLKFEKPNAISLISADKTTAKFSIKPLDRGYGITIGNALRRVLLASIPGAALINVEIKGVPHEFSTIPGVKEGVVEIVLNLKDAIFRLDSVEPGFRAEVSLNDVDKEIITLGDLQVPAGVEVVNPEHVICHLNKGTSISLTATLATGAGYVTQNDNKAYLDHIGQIALDSIFTPVKRVNFNVEKLQGGYDELILEVETNGAIDAKDAVSEAASMLSELFGAVRQISENAEQFQDYIAEEAEATAQAVDKNLAIDRLDLSVRLYNALSREGIKTIDQLLDMTDQEIKSIRNLGQNSFIELQNKLAEFKDSTITKKTVDDDDALIKEIFDDIEEGL